MRAYNNKFVESVAGTNYYSGITSRYEYRLWDADQNSACVCDAGYGGIDCSLRECPKGDDPLTTTAPTCGGITCQDEVQSFSVDGSQKTPGTYYITVTDFNGIAFKTVEFPLFTDSSANDPDWPAHKAANEGLVKAVLESLPNNITGTVHVTSAGGGAGAKDQYRLSVTFGGKSGNVPEMALGWTGTSNPNTRRAFVFQPGQPVQSAFLPSALGSSAYVTVTVYPMDQTLYGLDTYWSSGCTAIAVSTSAAGEADVADGIVAALNSIPAIKLTYGSPFIRDSNVVAQFKAATATQAAGYNVRVAFPDKQFGLADIVVNTFPTSACAAAAATKQTVVPYNDVADGNKEYVTCANRGLCDFKSGLCACFTGYTGVACEVQSTLAA